MPRGRYPIAPCGTAAGARRHYRHGEKPCFDCATAARNDRALRKGYEMGNTQVLDPREVRNGLPEFVPYVYRGAEREAP